MNQFFTVIYEGTDLSKKLKDFGTGEVALELAPLEHIYVGYYKPSFTQFYVELKTKNTVPNVISAEFYDGTIWQPLNTFLDESEGFTKSGFLFFERPKNWKAATVEGQENFYIRLSTNEAHSAGTTLKGLAILLSNDLDLEGVRSNIVSKLNNGASWVLKHEQAAKDILQELRNKGNRVVKNANSSNQFVTEGARFSDLTLFDLLEPMQLRQASLYKTLSMIYLDELSDEVDDKWHRQGTRYEENYAKMVNLFYLQLDVDDDGKASAEETRTTTGTVLSWL
jgi:hypothetical protein